ncbi:MAG: hypothetical protein GY862_19525 [Gammaproteobacteria bacterium]|nr:hypothetical protein [Gammaproteobacteria bacterium]
MIYAWLLDFSDVYYRTFLSQYLSFKTRTVLTSDNTPWEFPDLIAMAKQTGHEKLCRNIGFFQEHLAAEREAQAMNMAFAVPGLIVDMENAFCLVMIDEIQFMTKHIFYDEELKVPARHLPGAYHGRVESKVAPMLVSGSYVGWMMQMMMELFKGGRLKRTGISPKLAVNEGMEAVYRYASAGRGL